MPKRLSLVLLVFACGAAGVAVGDDGSPSVFEIPRILADLASLRAETQVALREGRHADAIERATRATKLVPFDTASHYDLARAQAQTGDPAGALESLRRVVALSPANNISILLRSDPHFTELRELPEFRELTRTGVTVEADVSSRWKWDINPSAVQSGIALVSEKNTGWDSQLGAFLSFFSLPADDQQKEVIEGHGALGELLRRWYAAGTAAGNHGDLYDNHDNKHSILQYVQFPQMARIEFDAVVQRHQFHHGLQNRFLYNLVVLGNSSTAITNGPLWRSQARLAYTDGRSIHVLHTQYRTNQLYIYPEHRDHDAGHNGRGDGYGDVFPANTPYIIISQGSSGSDLAFLDAVACTLAAFRPDVKRALVKHGILMPTVQMILRRCYRESPLPEDYFDGRAHPTVFDGLRLDEEKMVRMAHEIKSGEEPPVVQLQVVEEDQSVPGRDYFHPGGENLFDTPSAIARIARSTNYRRRMVVSAEQSFDINQRPLKYRWAVLRGNKSSVQIKPLNENGSRVELRVAYHRRRWIRPLSKIDSNRVDIGAFVFNGVHPSAPGFVTFFWLDNELREYDTHDRIKSVRYRGRPEGNYVDPAIDLPKRWRDAYDYDEQGRLLGWTRIRGTAREDFTADGALVLERDAAGRPQKARTVNYTAARKDQLSVLQQDLGHEILYYQYRGDDRVGKVVRKEPVAN